MSTIMLKWIIIGGGLHGVYLSNLLLHETDANRDDIRIIDPSPRPLTVWHRQTDNCGMAYLRSPATHTIDRHILSIHRFSKTPEGRAYADFIPPYYRPSLALFNRHCDHIIRENGLDRLFIQGRALGITSTGDGLAVETGSERLTARRIILALGMSDRLYWPGWAKVLKEKGALVHHVFELSFNRHKLEDRPRTWIVGGGLTGIQLALALCEQLKGEVVLCARHPVKENNLDFDPCWIGPKCLTDFKKLAYRRRRQIVNRSRNRGTVTEETAAAFHQACHNARLHFLQARIQSATYTDNRIRLKTDQGFHDSDQLILATGFDRKRPGGRLVSGMIDALHLKTSACGFPVLDPYFRWHERIFVTGALAELQGGPCARNIVGVRNMGRYLLACLRNG